MSGWDFDSNNSGGSAKAEFTKFPVGVTRIRVLDEEPKVRWTHWMQQHKRSINCPGKGCPICEVRKQQKANKEPNTYAMGRRFAMNIYNLETGKVEIMEQGLNFFQDLKDLREDADGDLTQVIIKVRRRGEGKDDTSYRLDIDTKEPLSLDEATKLSAMKTNLDEYFKPHTNEQILRIISGEAWDTVMKSETTESSDDSNEEFEVR